MSDFWDWFFLILFGGVLYPLTKIGMDWWSTKEFSKIGIREKNWLAAGTDGKPDRWKVYLLIAVPYILLIPAFFLFPESDDYYSGLYWDRGWTGFGFIIAIGAAVWMYFHNMKLIKNKIERMRRTQGGIL